jgi:hypothetical protein
MRCKIVHEEEKKAAENECTSLERALAAAAADLEKAKRKQTASKEWTAAALQREKELKAASVKQSVAQLGLIRG